MTTSSEVDALVRRVMPLLAGRGPELQSSALADLVAMLFAGHHPAVREECIELWINLVRELIPFHERVEDWEQTP